jgi:23S rRNA (adenine2503-C2)-methyltransferase
MAAADARDRPPIQALTFDELAGRLEATGLAAPGSHVAARVYRAVHLDGATSFDAIPALGRGRSARLATLFELPRLEPVAVHAAADGSARYAFRLADGAVIESVLLPPRRGRGARGAGERSTICVSSQAGCPLACAFCATGRLGLRRNLEAWEIVAQLHEVARHARTRLSDVVFMGMGEPLLNEAAVFRAATVMTQPHGLQIGARRITISTAGVVPAIHRFVAARRPFRLVFSLGSADPAKRRRLMPIQERFGYEPFLDAVRAYERFRRGRHVTLEVVAIRGLTMGDDDVEAIRRNLTGFRYLLNVIPFNPIGNELEAPTMAEVRAWTARLRPLGIPVKIRLSGGRAELAGCGQLGRTLQLAG